MRGYDRLGHVWTRELRLGKVWPRYVMCEHLGRLAQVRPG